MSNKKISSIDWLVEQLEKHHVKQDLKNTAVFQQAKEMHKQEIVDSFNEGALDTLPFGEEYYQYVYEVK
jgi:hypothetical protein